MMMGRFANPELICPFSLCNRTLLMCESAYRASYVGLFLLLFIITY